MIGARVLGVVEAAVVGRGRAVGRREVDVDPGGFGLVVSWLSSNDEKVNVQSNQKQNL